MVENLENEYINLKDKIILFIIHKERRIEGQILENEIIPDSISLLDEKYEQIFIDNLKGKDHSIIFQIIKKNNNDWFRDYLITTNFIEENIHEVLNYIKFKILFETKELNNDNFIDQISLKIINKDEVKRLLINNLIKQGEKEKKNIIQIALDTYKNNEKGEDFFQIIDNKIKNKFILFFLNLLCYLFRRGILLPLIYNFDTNMKNEYLNNEIKTALDNTSFIKNRMKKNINKISIYNNFKISKSKTYINNLISYVKKELIIRYLKTEGELRKYLPENEISNITKNYYREINLYEDNITNEINKYQFFKALYESCNNDLKKFIMEDYLYYFIINCVEEEKVGYEMSEKLLNFLKLILSLKLGENGHSYRFENSINEFKKIVLFTQGYADDIKNILKLFIEFSKYCENINERIIKILDENMIKYEISLKNKKYTQIVNNSFFFIVEAFIRIIMIFSSELIKKDKIKFKEYFSHCNKANKFFQNLSTKFSLPSKEALNIEILIKIEESIGSEQEQFEKN